MKTIQEVSIWENGVSQKAEVLNTYAVNVSLNNSATFWYGLFALEADGKVGKQLSQGNISMGGDDYAAWESDDVAWNFIANKLNLTITGDCVAPVEETPEVTPEPKDETSVEEVVE